jgi:aldehyde dehydrogenase (NAD+)
VCHAGTRIYVHEDIYDAFLAAFAAKMATVKVGTNFSSETDQGPQINKPQYDKILGYIETSKEEGATLHLGGHPLPRDGGYFIEPTIFTDVTPDMKVCDICQDTQNLFVFSHSMVTLRKLMLNPSF